MSRQIINSLRISFLSISLLVFIGCSFGQDLLEPTLTTKNQWANKVGGRTYVNMDGEEINFDFKGNIETQQYTDYFTGDEVKRTYTIEAAVNAYTTVYKVVDSTMPPANNTYYIGYAVDNGAILYRTDRTTNPALLVDPASVGLDSIEKISELEKVSMDKLENAKLRSLHMAGHRTVIEEMSDIKMNMNASWLSALSGSVFMGEYVITTPKIDTSTSLPEVDGDGNIVYVDYSTFAYLRLGAIGRMDANYLIKTNASSGVINDNATIAEVKTAAQDTTAYPFVNENYTNTSATYPDGGSIEHNFLSTTKSMVYTNNDGITTFISGVGTQVYTAKAELLYSGYKYSYMKLRIMNDGNLELVDTSFFVPLPDVATKPYYGLPKNIVLSNKGTFTPPTIP